MYDGDDEPSRQLRRRPLSSVRIVRTCYLWTDYLPAGELTMLVGKPGIGKSTIAVDVAAKVTRGTLAGDSHGQPRPVLYSLTEDAEAVFKARFVAAGGNPDLLHLLDVTFGASGGSPLLVTADLHQLHTAVTDLQPALVVLDALNSSITGQHNDNANVRPQLEMLKSLAHHTSTAVLGVGHFRKSTAGADPLDSIGGAGAYGQVVRQALGCARDDDDGSCVLSVIKSNLGRLDVDSLAYRIDSATVTADDGIDADTGRVTWHGPSTTHVSALLQRGPEGDDERSERDEAADWLVDYLTANGGTAPAGETIKAASAVGIAKTTLTRARKRANVHSAKAGMTGGWVWSLEESTEESEESTPQSLDSSVPSVVPSADNLHLAVLPGRCPHGYALEQTFHHCDHLEAS